MIVLDSITAQDIQEPLVSSDNNITSVDTAPTILSTSPEKILTSESNTQPCSVSTALSLFNKVGAEQPHRAAEVEDVKSTQSTSNKYSNKTKAKVHLGACSIGALTFGVLAGPVALVFVPTYLNAVLMASYGGSGFDIGENASPKAKPEAVTSEPDQSEHSASQTPPRPARPDQPDGLDHEEEEDPNHRDVPPGPFQFHSKGGNFTFAPVYAPNITINEAPNITINGNIYFTQAGETGRSSHTNSTNETSTKPDKRRNETAAHQGEQLRATRITKMTSEQVSSMVSSATSVIGTQIVQTLVAGGGNAHHVSFNDGAQAIVTGLPAPVPSLHHRGKGFMAFNEASVCFSQGSQLKEKIKDGDINVGKTHSWRMNENRQWALVPIVKPNTDDVKPISDDARLYDEHKNKPSQAQGRVTEQVFKRNTQQILTPPVYGVNGNELEKASGHQGSWLRVGNSWIKNSESKIGHSSSVILSSGSAQAISSQHSNLTAGVCNNISDLSIAGSDDSKRSSELPTSSTQQVNSNIKTNESEQLMAEEANDDILVSDVVREPTTQAQAIGELVSENNLDTVNSNELEKATGHQGSWFRKDNHWIPNSESKFRNSSSVILSSGSAQAISSQHSNLTAGVCNNIADLSIAGSDDSKRSSELPTSSTQQVNSNIKTNESEQLMAEEANDEILVSDVVREPTTQAQAIGELVSENNLDTVNSNELEKATGHQGSWFRKDNHWIPNSESKFGHSSSVILSLGSSQAVPSTYSNRVTGLLNNMSAITLKKNESVAHNEVDVPSQRQHIIGGRPAKAMQLTNFVYHGTVMP
ncbi:hypothetical protein [Aeromonas sp. DNP9]|uniref:hypothetical protein n=1 Tax=Aeromonas sp. DNP9 TaxID=1535548 RepID=UPI000A6BB8D0|nr:hypothetical protein [Aeromonas sp. DNP9]